MFHLKQWITSLTLAPLCPHAAPLTQKYTPGSIKPHHLFLFRHLRSRVFENRNLKVSTKVAVYNALCLSTLLYGAKSWTPYRQHISNLEAFHIRCLQKILGLSWEDRILRMPEHRLPRQVLYSQLMGAKRSAGGQKWRFKD